MEPTVSPAAAAAARLTVDIVSDVVCPWCYIGKRRLEAALARLHDQDDDLAVSVRWHPFQLNPDLPTEGIDRRSYLESKFGGRSARPRSTTGSGRPRTRAGSRWRSIASNGSPIRSTRTG